MEFTAKQLAQILNGNVEGDENAKATSFAKIEHGKNGQLSFYANPKYEQYVYSSKASIMLVNKDFEPKSPVSATLVRVDNAYSALAELLKHVAAQNKSHKRRRSLFTAIPCSAKIGRKVSIGAHCHIGKKCLIGDYSIIGDNVSIGENTRIGKNCTFYSGVSIYPNTVIGDNVILHSGCVVGSDGFGNAPQPDGTWQKIEHLGNVIIGDNVELGANTCVDRAPMESTIIGNGVKIDNLCHIAHNVQIGDNTVMAAQSGIAGSTVIGRNCMIAGQVGIVGHVKIADNTTVCAKSGVIGNVRQPGQVIFGIPAIDRALYLKSFALFKQAGQEK